MKSYIDIQVMNFKGTVVFDRSIADCDLDSIPFNMVIESLHLLYPGCSVIITSSIPKSV